MEMVNICGIEENEFEDDGWCRRCRNTCEMIPLVMVEKQIYDFAKRHIIKGDKLGTTQAMFSTSEFVYWFLGHPSRYQKAPKYVKKYLKGLGVDEDAITHPH